MEADRIRNIVLIGFSGTGKTTVGRLVAKKLERDFVDIDLAIEERCGMSVESIFQSRGEAYFREQEKELVRELSARDGQVISTGGGIVLFSENVTELKQNGILIALNAPAEVVLARITQDSVVRPLLKKPDPLEAIRKMMLERTEKYMVADFALDTGNLSPEEIAGTIIEALILKGCLTIGESMGGNQP